MKLVKRLQRSMIFAVICALLFSPMQVVQAEDLKTITATGTMTGEGGEAIPLTMTFPPAGGKVTGSVNYEGVTNKTSCPITFQLNLEGTFVGGDGGSATGTTSGTEVVNYKSGGFTLELTGPWSGNFYANGTGNGIWDFTTNALGKAVSGQLPWQVTFSAEEFAAALEPPVTSEYISNTYGIRVEDSFGGDGWDQKSWSDHEIGLLNDVLKTLPPGFMNQISLTRIVRNKVKFDENGNPDPKTMGTYYSCDEKTDPDCTGASSTIRIFDNATKPAYFPNDPDKEFKVTILHEIMHAYQYHKDKNSIYKKATNSPQVQNYIEATRLYTYEGADPKQNGWDYSDPPGEWVLTTTRDNVPPLKYGKKNPLEDMSVSVSMYVYDPSKLKSASVDRYNYIRDYIFGGVEYDNGKKK